MKQLTCEMCGSTDLTKIDGVFVCQTCNTKYSVEEAKKMMVEGTVEVQGTVRVDNTSSVANFLKMAESAYVSDNKKEAENYCNKIIEIDSENHAAWFLKGKSAGWQSTLAVVRIEESVNCFLKSIESAPDNLKEIYKQEASKEVENLSLALHSLSCNNFAKNPTESNISQIGKSLKLIKKYTLKLLINCGIKSEDFTVKLALIIDNAVNTACKDVILEKFNSERCPSNYEWKEYVSGLMYCEILIESSIGLSNKDGIADIQRYKNAIKLREYIKDSFLYQYAGGTIIKIEMYKGEKQNVHIDKIMEYHSKIKEIDDTYIIPTRPQPKEEPKPGSSGGCYVATAVYGSYDCPEVWTLRRFRDDILAENLFGRAFIHTYYAISPTLVEWFGETKWFKKLWKSKLDNLVKNLEEKGIDNTPYEDKRW